MRITIARRRRERKKQSPFAGSRGGATTSRRLSSRPSSSSWLSASSSRPSSSSRCHGAPSENMSCRASFSFSSFFDKRSEYCVHSRRATSRRTFIQDAYIANRRSGYEGEREWSKEM